MASYSHVVLMGNLTRDPELKTTSGGHDVCSFSLALNRKKADGTEEVSYIDCELWGNSAKAFAEHMQKGRSVLIDGQLRQQRWESDGQKRSRVVVAAWNFTFVGPPPEKKQSTPDNEPPDLDTPF